MTVVNKVEQYEFNVSVHFPYYYFKTKLLTDTLNPYFPT